MYCPVCSLMQKEKDVSHGDQYMETFEQYAVMKSSFTGRESDPSVLSLLKVFRDLCSIIWMLNNRDALSLALQQKATDFHKHVRTSSVSNIPSSSLVSIDGHTATWFSESGCVSKLHSLVH